MSISNSSGLKSILAQLKFGPPLSVEPQAFKPPKMLSDVNPTNLKIETRFAFQKQPLDSEDTSNIFTITIKDDDDTLDKSFSLAQLLDLKNRNISLISIGVQLLPTSIGTPGPGSSARTDILLAITTKCILLPQTEIVKIP